MNDREMIDDPDRWPFLQLPMKKMAPDGGWPAFGFLSPGMAWAGPERVLHLGPMVKPTGGTVTYESTEALLADGWVVD